MFNLLLLPDASTVLLPNRQALVPICLRHEPDNNCAAIPTVQPTE